MKFKRIRLLVLVIMAMVTITSLFPAVTHCQERDKPSVLILFLNHAKTTYDEEIDLKLNNWLDTKVSGIYNVVPSEAYQKKLNSLGIEQISTLEKAELIEMTSAEDIDYLIVAELNPFIRKERITVFTYGKDMTAHMVLKMIDIPSKRYLYNGKFIIKGTDTSTDWWIGNKSVAMKALDSVLIEMGEVISYRLPLQPPKQHN